MVVIKAQCSDTILASVPIEDFNNYAKMLFDGIKDVKGSSVPAPDSVCEFAKVIYVSKPKAPAVKALKKQFGGKNDIFIEVRDGQTAIVSIMGFSIKSKFGQPPTLFNAGSSSQFLYKLSGCNDKLMEEFNAITDNGGRGWAKCKAYLIENGITMEFAHTQNKIYNDNLFLVRESMAKIMAWCVKDRLIDSTGHFEVMETVERMIAANPLKVPAPQVYYEKAIKDFLMAGFTGMTAGKVWDGREQVNGGYIVVMDDGDVICLRIADFDYSRFRFKDLPEEKYTIRHYTADQIENLQLEIGDILIEKSGGGEKTPVGRTVLFDKKFPALFANFMDRLKCHPSILPSFMQYVLVTFYKNEYTRNYIKQTTGIQNLDLTSMLSGETIAIPTIEEQTRIAGFLERKCLKIDSVISDTKRTIEEYKTLKQSIITEAVTRGVRGNRPMKDSGVAWIGMIPEEWDIKKGKWLLSLLEQPVLEDDGVITCFRDGEVTLRSNRREDGFTISLQEAGYQGINVGDLVVHGMDGFAGAIGISDSRGKGTPVLNVMESTQDKRYIMYYLRIVAVSNYCIDTLRCCKSAGMNFSKHAAGA